MEPIGCDWYNRNVDNPVLGEAGNPNYEDVGEATTKPHSDGTLLFEVPAK